MSALLFCVLSATVSTIDPVTTRWTFGAPTVHSVRLFYPEREIHLSERNHQGIVAKKETLGRDGAMPPFGMYAMILVK